MDGAILFVRGSPSLLNVDGLTGEPHRSCGTRTLSLIHEFLDLSNDDKVAPINSQRTLSDNNYGT